MSSNVIYPLKGSHAHCSQALSSLPVGTKSATGITPDVIRVVKAVRRLSRLFRVKRLTTRSSVNFIVYDLLDTITSREYLSHSAFHHDPSLLERVYKESRLLDLYHDMLLEEDFFGQPEVRSAWSLDPA